MEQLQLLFTRDEVDTYIKRASDNTNLANSVGTFRVIKNLDFMTNDDKTILYNQIASANGWTEVDFITNTYTVEVTYNGYTIAEVEGVEADSAEEACEKVGSEMDIHQSDLTLGFTFNGNSYEGEVFVEPYYLTDELGFTAHEED